MDNPARGQVGQVRDEIMETLIFWKLRKNRLGFVG